jgi:hypothetical protein
MSKTIRTLALIYPAFLFATCIYAGYVSFSEKQLAAEIISVILIATMAFAGFIFYRDVIFCYKLDHPKEKK